VTTELMDAMAVLVLVELVHEFHLRNGRVIASGTRNMYCLRSDRLKSKYARQPLRIVVFRTRMLVCFQY